MKTNHLLLENIKKEIENAQIISFDIFDTLLLRPYAKPTDLFLHIEKIENKPFFAQLRQNAERDARRRYKEREDITLDEIYEEIDDNFKSLKQTELQFEEMVLSANPELKQVYDYALKKDKRIIITSDMYLPTDFLAAILKKNGFTDFERIFVSEKIKKTKTTGHLYKHILDEMNVNPKEILHIGDNIQSDYQKAREFGINAVLYTQVMKQFLAQNLGATKFLKQNQEKVGASILVAFLALKWQDKRCGIIKEKSYWEDLGYTYAGPLAYGYMRFIQKEAIKNNLSRLLFVARDGYTLQKVFKVIDSNIKTAYIYAPRFLNLICRLDYVRENIKQSQAIIDYYSQKSDDIKETYNKIDVRNEKSNHQFIQNNLSLFLPLSQKVAVNYKKYLNQVVQEDERIGIVDTITAEFSSQKLLQHFLKNKALGFYWGVIKTKYQHNFEYCTFNSNDAETSNGRDVFTENWNFVEFLITSLEYPVKNITQDGQPIYDANPITEEVKRARLYPEISQSAVLFAKEIKCKFNGYDIFLDGKILIDWINSFIDNPSLKDITYMSDIKVGIDSGHTEYVPLFVEKISVLDFIKKPVKIIKRLRKNVWRTSRQKILLCLFKPISFRMRGLKRFQLGIFPALSEQYFIVSLTFSRECFYKFFIGKDKK